jgi:hypothetical protein
MVASKYLIMCGKVRREQTTDNRQQTAASRQQAADKAHSICKVPHGAVFVVALVLLH